jgi:hypothetical protein
MNPEHDGIPDPSAPQPAELGIDRTTRALTVILAESDWQALRRLEPDPVDWLKGQIRHRLGDRMGPQGR